MSILNKGNKDEKAKCNKCGDEIPDGMMFCPRCDKNEFLEIDDFVIQDELFDPSVFMHDSDRRSLKALKLIPGFTPCLKAFMSIWNERLFRIQNLSSCLRISEKQLPEYYKMLPPICDKLEIEIPELYLMLDPGNPNAWTYGDTKPFITITTGLLETMPKDLIPTILAHECGHIACHHVLYRTMGSIILDTTYSAASKFVPDVLTKFVSAPLQIAFAYWMRCSEYSADRAAAYYNGGSDKIIETCLRLAGYDKDIIGSANIESFMEQAIEFRELVDNNKLDKAIELMLICNQTHPFLSNRAYESKEWTTSEEFKNLIGK